MDIANVHWSVNALKFYKENNLGLIDWHLNIPYLNSIKNIWVFLKIKIGDQKYTKNQLISRIHIVWNEISDEQIKNMKINILENSMKHWCERKINKPLII